MPRLTLDDVSNMSDEDFLRVSSDPETEWYESESEEADEEESDDDDQEEETPEDDDSDDDSDDDEESEEEDESDEDDSEGEEEDEEDDQESEEDSSDESDYKAMIEALFSPFPANGTEIKVESIEEAQTLMKMGANYHMKMSILKPNMRFLKTLEKNDLLDEDKLNHLIDLAKGDKGAINKLIRDNSIDPMDLNTEEDTDYSPDKHTVSDRSVELDEVIDQFKDQPAFSDVMSVVTGQWGESSREILVKEPSKYIPTLMAHKANGTFDRINAEVTRRRMLGMIPNSLSDIEAYEKVGIELVTQANASNTGTPEPKPKPTKKAGKDPSKVASPRGKKPSRKSNKIQSIDDLAAMSDEEILKLGNKQYF